MDGGSGPCGGLVFRNALGPQQIDLKQQMIQRGQEDSFAIQVRAQEGKPADGKRKDKTIEKGTTKRRNDKGP